MDDRRWNKQVRTGRMELGDRGWTHGNRRQELEAGFPNKERSDESQPEGLGGIKHFFLAHGEKLGIVIVGAIARDDDLQGDGPREACPRTRTPTSCSRRSRRPAAAWTASTGRDAKTEFADRCSGGPAARAERARQVRQGRHTVRRTWNIPWDPSPVPPIVLRTDPVLARTAEISKPTAARGCWRLSTRRCAGRRCSKSSRSSPSKPPSRRSKRMKWPSRKNAAAIVRGGGEPRDRIGRRVRSGASQATAGGRHGPPEGVPLQDYEEVRIAHWAVVVAKVPIKEQVKLYRDAFENARGYNPAADMPQYLGYFVERAEVRGGDEDDELKWERRVGLQRQGPERSARR